MPPGGSQKKIANSLVTLSSAAILTVYAAGFLKTRAAAALLDEASNERRPPVPMPAPATAGELVPPAPIEPPTPIAVEPTAARSPAVVATSPRKTRRTPLTAPVVEATPAPAPVAASSAPAAAPVVVAAPEAAKPSVEEPAPAPLLMPKDMYKDGTFLGWGSSRHGDIQASVTITNGRFVSASIAQCLTRYSCSWVAHLPPQVIARQSPDVDYVSGATQSANAFYWAVIDALKKAR